MALSKKEKKGMAFFVGNFFFFLVGSLIVALHYESTTLAGTVGLLLGEFIFSATMFIAITIKHDWMDVYNFWHFLLYIMSAGILASGGICYIVVVATTNTLL